MPDILHQLSIQTSAENLFDAITTQSGLSGWWTEQTVAQPKVGFLNEFRFGERYFNQMRVDALQPHAFVEWTVLQGDREWIGTRINFRISQGQQDVHLLFGHRDWRESTEFYAHCNFQWAHYLRSLKQLCETGTGTPFRPGR